MQSKKLPSSLNDFQKKMYEHLIEKKWERYPQTKGKPGKYKDHFYDAIFPEDFKCDYPPMLHKKSESSYKKLDYKLHKFSSHAVSSQTACVNLFLPLLESKYANDILRDLCAAKQLLIDFKEINRKADGFYKGFRFEFWDKGKSGVKGYLNDHTSAAGTDADIAIAYKNSKDENCIWLIEHKLTEAEFTTCGGYRSKHNAHKDVCTKCNPFCNEETQKKCRYSIIGYNYWETTNDHKAQFSEKVPKMSQCPFKSGMNQLWRNQLLALKLKENRFDNAFFSVVYHSENESLEKKLNAYAQLFSEEAAFSAFTSKDIFECAQKYGKDLSDWLKWYDEMYLSLDSKPESN